MLPEFKYLREEFGRPSMVKVDFLGLWSIIFCGPLDAALSREFSLSLDDGMPCVVIRVGFVVRAIVGNTPGDYFWIVTTGEGTFGVSPIVLRLAPVVGGHGAGRLGARRMPGVSGEPSWRAKSRGDKSVLLSWRACTMNSS